MCLALKITSVFSKRTFSSQQNKIVYISQSTNPYDNLALENWLYEKVNFSFWPCLFIWRNKPTVVIGRHQNPWTECDPEYLNENGVNLARRNSGGGAVYHDLGNINLTFFTNRQGYNRKKNLTFLTDTLNTKWDKLQLEFNCRDDIVMKQDYKISGSAAKLGRETAYHHCTLLLQSNTNSITSTLQQNLLGIQSKATQSTRSRVKNMSDIYPNLSYDDIVNELSNKFMSSSNKPNKGIFYIDPTNSSYFPGVLSYGKQLKTFEWIYGKTPKFSIQREFIDNPIGQIKLDISIEKGKIKDLLYKRENLTAKEEKVLQQIKSCMVGTKLLKKEILNRIATLQSSSVKNSFFTFACKTFCECLIP